MLSKPGRILTGFYKKSLYKSVCLDTLLYYKGERGNKPYELDLMLHLHILRRISHAAYQPSSRF